jgi:hypothetical protein
MTNTPDIGAVIADLAYATEALAEIRAIALEALAQTTAAHDPLLDIVNAASYGLRLHPKETPCSTR